MSATLQRSKFVALLTGAFCAAILPGPGLTNPAADPTTFSVTTPGAVSTTVPDGVCGFIGTVTGGGGASQGINATLGGIGGGGALIGATFKVLPLQAVTGTVAGGGTVSTTGLIGPPGGTGTSAGGAGGDINSATIHKGGSGGGSSSISVAGQLLIHAGGGGGGGAAHQVPPAGNGGAAGAAGIAAGAAVAGANGSVGSQATGIVGGGQGGQTGAGGTGGDNSTTPARNGSGGGGIGAGAGGAGGPDNGTDSGGGGGGGYTGGGGGSATNGDSRTGGGGGGGSSFLRATSPTVTASAPTGISGTTVAGPAAGQTNGPAGAATLDWVPCLYTLNVVKSVATSPVNSGGRVVWTVAVTNTGPDPMTRGDLITLTDTLPLGPNGAPTPQFRVLSMGTSGGTNADMASGAVTCTGLSVGAAMPASTVCSRPYSALSAPGAPAGGTRGLNSGETLTITYEQIISSTALCSTITNTATVRDRTTAGASTVRSDAEPLTINCYDLRVTKTASPTVQSAGDVITWTVTATNLGPAPMSGPDDTAANPLIVNDVAPVTNVGTPAAFTSSGPAGACTYAGSVITCPGNLASGQTQTFTFQQTINVAAPNGATITNPASVTDFNTSDSNDSANAVVTVAAKPRLTLAKTVTNDNGGTNVDTDFTLTATGPSTITGIEGAAAVTNAIVNPGTYTLTESGAATAAYTQGTWTCTAGTLTGNSLALIAGQTASCTITNNDRPRLTLLKNVTNNNGGTALDAAFTLTATGPVTASGIEGAAAVTNANVNAGTYALSETGPAGYTGSAWSCVGGTLAGSNLTLAQNQNATCTITNDDVAPQLTLLKTVTNDNGGTNVDTDFTLTATGPTTITGVEGAAAVTNAAVNAGTYILTESGAAIANYTQGTWTCTAGTLTGNSLVLGVGQSASCTITNNDRPRLTLLKTVTNNNGGAALDTAFTLTATGPVTASGIEGAAAVTNVNVNAGTYTLSESSVAGYTGGAWSCVGGTLTGSSLVLTQAQNATCTVTNDDQAATLTLLKTVTNDNGGTNVDTDFTLTATGPTTITGIEGAPSVTAAAVNAGTYVLTESGAATTAYTQGTWTCTAGTLTGNSLVLANGQSASCTITNNDRPRLTLLKTVINNSGGTALDTAFTLTATGPVTVSGIEGAAAVTNANVNAGTYALSESSVAGYTGGAWSCVGGTLTGSSLVLAQNQNATCTVTNDDQAATLTLLKIVTNDNGGTNVDTDFTLTATGPTTITGIEGAASVTAAAVNAGTYVLTESGAATAAYTQGTWSCTAGTLTGNSLVLANGQSASCTITNNDRPRLTLLKTVINNSGGTALDTAFTLTATGPVTASGIEGAAAVTNANVNAGTYALTESSLAGYTGGAWSCVGGTLTGSSLVLTQAQNATCSVTNDDQAATLTLVKTVTNDNGGTNVDTDFTLTATGPTTITGIEGAASVTAAAVSAGTYTLTESGVATAAYTPGSWTCTAGTLTGNSLVLANGQSASCTITNNDRPRLTLLKTVINNSGGAALDTAFTLTAAGPVTVTGAEGALAVTNANVNAGTYTLSESSLAGYTGGAWSCVGGTLTGSSLVLTQAQNATCTVTNDDQAATLTLLKTVTNDNGGTAVDTDFTLTATGPTTISGIEGAASVTAAVVNAGTYILTESGAVTAAYTQGLWTCTAGALTGNSLVLANGQSASCAITNNDRPRLTLLKTVINNSGGTALDTAFTLTATGPVTVSGVEGAVAVTNANVSAGTYTLSESSLAGYTGGAWSCVGGTLAGSSLVLTQSQNATCTVTNDDQSATLTLLKTVTNDNGGTNVDTDFTLTANGPTSITGIEGAASVTAAAVNAGTYVLTESGPATAAYTPGSWTCTAGTLTGSSLVLANGQSASCTITNNDRPRLTLLKTVINNSGGSALDTAFTLKATGPVTISGVEGNASVTGANVNAGTYALTESALAGYTGGAWSCVGGTQAGSNITLTQAQNATCTVTNDDQPATLTLSKSIVNTGGGTAVLADFPLTAAGSTPLTGISGSVAVTGAAVNAGTYALSEVTNSDYTASAWSCTGGSLSGGNLTLALGETASCTITNTFVPAPELTIQKTADTVGPLIAGQTVNYSYLVENTGNVTITGVNVAETAFNGSGTPPNPVAGGPTTIAPGQTVTFTAPYVVTQQDVDTLQ